MKKKKKRFRDRYFNYEKSRLAKRKKIEHESQNNSKFSAVLLATLFGGALVYFIVINHTTGIIFCFLLCVMASLILIKAFFFNTLDGKILYGSNCKYHRKINPGCILNFLLTPQNNAFWGCVFVNTLIGSALCVFLFLMILNIWRLVVLFVQFHANHIRDVFSCFFWFIVNMGILYGLTNLFIQRCRKLHSIYHQDYKHNNTIVELGCYPLLVGQSNNFYIYQCGNYMACQLKVFLQLDEGGYISTGKGKEDTIHKSKTLVKHLIFKSPIVDITIDTPLECSFSFMLSHDDYVPTMQHSFSSSGIDWHHWTLIVSLYSMSSLILQRKFPVPVQLRQEVRREEEDELKPDH